MRILLAAVAIVFAGQTPAVAAGGVQPDPPSWGLDRIDQRAGLDHAYHYGSDASGVTIYVIRSEERRVGKECRSRWSPYH